MPALQVRGLIRLVMRPPRARTGQRCCRRLRRRSGSSPTPIWRRSTPLWRRRTNVWRWVTSPARGPERPRNRTKRVSAGRASTGLL